MTNVTLKTPLATIARWLRPTKLPLFRIVGVEPHSQLSLTLLCGVQRQNKSFLLGLAFAGLPAEQLIGKADLKFVLQTSVAQETDASLLMLTADQPRPEWAGGNGWFFIPGWVNGEIALPLPDRVAKSEKVKSDRRRIRRQQYEVEIKRGAKAHRDYYRTMHLPFVRRAHGDAAMLDPLAELRPLFTPHELLLLRKRGESEPVAGAMLLHERGVPRLSTFGVRDGDLQLARDGAICALYHFCLAHLTAQNFPRVHTGRARPFLRDGVLNYKRKWGNRITGSFWHWFAPGFALKILALTPATKSFLQHNPFICETAGELHGVVFTDALRPLRSEIIAQLAKDFFYPGLDKLVIYCFRPACGSALDEIPAEFAARIFIRAADERVGTNASAD
ncbi:MAG: hypothetical protein RLZZ350_101 [Verrucomicrobiota bacterium]|jgi:hypothetical protein